MPRALASSPFGHGIFVDPGEEEAPQLVHGLGDLGPHAQLAGFGGLGDHVGDQGVDALPMALGPGRRRFPGEYRIPGEIPGPDGVVDVVVDIGNAVGNPDNPAPPTSLGC